MEKNELSRRGFIGGLAALGACSSPGGPMTAPAAPAFRDALLAGLGGPWPEPCDLKPQVRGTQQKDGYRIETLRYEVEPGDRVPALLLVPDGVSATSPAAAVCVWHQHNGEWHLGKSEPAGLAGNPMHDTGARLARLGYVVLCPDALCFEERVDPTGKLKAGNWERAEFTRYVLQGRSMAWKNILDMRRAVDYLVTRPEVKADRIGCYGHSMGSTHAYMVGPWEPRLKVLVGNCCLPTYEAIVRDRILHCWPNYVPGLLQYGDTPDIVALIAPRRLHLNLGGKDTWSPVADVRRALPRMQKAWADAGAADKFSIFIEDDQGHVLSDAMWERVKSTFKSDLS